MEKHVIWDSQPVFEDWKDGLQDEYPDCSEAELRDLMYELNNDDLEEEKSNVRDILIPNGIICVGDLGLWRGRASGIYKNGDLKEVADCLRFFCDGMSELTIYVDGKGELRSRETHHDGTNYYWFRAFKPEVSEEQKERLRDLIYNNQDYEPYLRRITYRLGDLIGNVYGWKFPHRPKASIQPVSV